MGGGRGWSGAHGGGGGKGGGGKWVWVKSKPEIGLQGLVVGSIYHILFPGSILGMARYGVWGGRWVC